MSRVVGGPIVALAVAVCAATAAGAPSAQRAVPLRVGVTDEAMTLYGNTDFAFQTLKALGVQVLRVNLYWGGTPWAVANRQPTDPSNPADPAYDWTLYDRLVRYAAAYGIKVMFSILFTPTWANDFQGPNVAPTDPVQLEAFAYAAAARYSGYWTPPPAQQDPSYGNGDTPLPAVTMWTAWNEPNNPVWLSPQYVRRGKKWRIQSAFDYAKICTAVYDGVHAVVISPEKGPPPGEQVACGVTAPRGNDAPRSSRPSVDPLSFMVAARAYGLRRFDVWAHNPYPLSGADPPTYVPTPVQHAVVLGNIGTLVQKLTQLWGPKHLWLTEYGYQTNPPNTTAFGVSWARQAQYMTQAYALARSNPRIDLMLWFLVRDDTNVTGWQSGLETASGKLKPSFRAFQRLAARASLEASLASAPGSSGSRR